MFKSGVGIFRWNFSDKRELKRKLKRDCEANSSLIYLPPANEVCEGYVFTGVCLSTGGRAWLLPGGRAWLLGGHAWLLRGGHAWLLRGHAWLLGGHVWLLPGGHAWLLWGEGACVVALGGVCGCSRGACVVALGGCAWLLPGRGACLVPPGGACVVAQGGHACCTGGGVCVVFSMRYGQWAGGTHPTGMHSC